MTQAFNLSQLANKVNTSGQLDVSTGASGTLPIANGGTNNGSLAVTAGGVIYSDGSKLVNVGAGTTGQALLSNGASAPTWGTSGGVSGMYATPITAGTYSFTVPAGVNWVNVFLSGGGGGGGGGRLATGGAGGLGQDNWVYVPVTAGSTYSIVIGAGGAGSTGTGATGGTSTFGGTLVTCTGGTGGTAASSATPGVTGSKGTVSTTGGTDVANLSQTGFSDGGGANGRGGSGTTSGSTTGTAGGAGQCTVFW